MPSRYRFADRLVISAIELPALQAASGAAVLPADSITISPPCLRARSQRVARWFHVWQEDSADEGLRMRREPAQDGTVRYRLRMPGLADFLIRTDPITIGIEPRKRTDADTLEHLLLDQALPRALAAAGELVVHASATVIDGRVALFLGRSGWGKSTLAAMLAHAGHPTLSDDCLLLRPGAACVEAVGTYPSLRLNPDSLAQFPETAQKPRIVASYSDKQRLAPASSEAAPCIAAAIYLLQAPEPDAPDAVNIDPLAPATACMALLEHGFRLDLGDRAENTRTLALAAAASRSLPAFSLAYPRDYARRDAIVSAIRGHFADLPSTGT